MRQKRGQNRLRDLFRYLSRVRGLLGRQIGVQRRPVGVTLEPVEQRPGFWPEWGVMTDEGFHPVQDDLFAARFALVEIDPADIGTILEHLDGLVAEEHEGAILIAERIRQEKEAAWRECWRAAVGLDEASNIPNPYKADQ